MGPQGGDFHVYEDGRLLISGSHLINIPEADLSGLYELVWVKTSGHLDTTRIHRKSNGVIYEIEEQPDGKFLCSGTGSTYEEQPVTVIFRIHPNGDLDTAFNAEVDYWGEAFEFLTLPDGRILAGGAFRTMDQQDTLCLIRMHPNGQLDQSFQPVRSKATFGAVSSGSYVLTIHRLPDGRLIIGGRFDHINDEVRGGIAMLTEDGGLVDEVFNGNGCGTYTPPASQFPVLGVASIREAPDGSFYIAGSYHGYDDGTTNDPLQRFVSRLYGLNVGVKELETVKLEVHPNPASDVVNIQIPADIRKAEFQFHDALGRLVHQEWITSVDRLSLDVGSWPAGLYQLQLIFEGSGRAVGKLIVE